MQPSRTIEAVTRSEFDAVTPADVIAETRALLPPDWDDDGICKQCQDLGNLLKSAVAYGTGGPVAGQDETAIRTLAALFEADTHVDSPGFQENVTQDTAWCDFDLWLVKQTVLLGMHGVPSILAWGPGHRPSATYPDDWADCRPCTDWVERRTDARQRISAAGSDPDLLLGSSDDPSFGHKRIALRPEEAGSLTDKDVTGS